MSILAVLLPAIYPPEIAKRLRIQIISPRFGFYTLDYLAMVSVEAVACAAQPNLKKFYSLRHFKSAGTKLRPLLV
jgi:hypothetical protein